MLKNVSVFSCNSDIQIFFATIVDYTLDFYLNYYQVQRNQEPETIAVLDWLRERKSFLRIFKIPFFEQCRYVCSLSIFSLPEFLLFMLALAPVYPTLIGNASQNTKASRVNDITEYIAFIIALPSLFPL